MYSRLSFGSLCKIKKILQNFICYKTFDFNKEYDFVMEIIDRKIRYNLISIQVYDGFEFYDFLVMNDSKDLIPNNAIQIKNITIARIESGVNFEVIIKDYDIIKSRKRKREDIDDPPLKKKQKLDSKNDFTNFKDIIEISNLKKKSFINVIGVIESFDKIKIIKTRKNNEDTELLNFTLIDENGFYVKCAIWGINALFFLHNYEIGEIIYLKNVHITQFDGITLSCIFKTYQEKIEPNRYLKTLALDYFFKFQFQKKEEIKSISYLATK